MQIALVDTQRRVQSRLSLPWMDVDTEWWNKEQAEGRPLLRLKELGVDWTEFRLLFRQATDILRRFDALEDGDHERMQTLVRDTAGLESIVTAWYASSPGQERVGDTSASAPIAGETGQPALLDQVLTLAMRPFLARAAEVMSQRLDLSGWRAPYCPFCGGEPDLAFITPAADRRLVCGRCAGQWAFDPVACPFCSNADRSRVTSFATRDGQYRIYGCDVCRRYLKAYDGRQSTRPVLPAVDSVATLPLDAAAIQKGYRS